MQKKQLFFILKFSILFLILILFFNIGFINNLFLEISMLIIKGFLILTGGTYTITGNQVVVNSQPLALIKECTGTPMYALYAAFALAFKVEKKKKLRLLLHRPPRPHTHSHQRHPSPPMSNTPRA